jgi:hypothetical protein
VTTVNLVIEGYLNRLKLPIKKRVCALDRTTEVKTSLMLVTDFK